MLDKRPLPVLAALLSGMVLLLVACAADDDDGGGRPPDSPASAQSGQFPAGAPAAGSSEPAGVLAVVEGTGPQLAGVVIEVNSLRRVTAEIVTLRVTLTNNGTEPMGYLDISHVDGTYLAPAASGVTLIDSGAKLRYYPLRDTSKLCVCTSFRGITDQLAPGEQIELTTSFPAPPPDVDSVVVDWASFTLTGEVPLS